MYRLYLRIKNQTDCYSCRIHAEIYCTLCVWVGMWWNYVACNSSVLVLLCVLNQCLFSVRILCYVSIERLWLAFSALTLLVRYQAEHPASKHWVIRCWHGYLSGSRCKWFAYGPTDATATPSSLASLKSRMVCLSGAILHRLFWKEAIKQVSSK